MEEKLDKIIAKFIMPSFMHNGIDKRAEAKHQILELIRETLQECIGEEEELGVDMPPYVEHPDYAERKVRNQLRQEALTKLEEMMK